MKFNVSGTLLFQQLQAVSRVLASKNSLQILECILFDLQGEYLTLTGTDGETTIRTVVKVDGAEGAGKVAFGAKLLLDTLKELPEQPVTFLVDDASFGLNITTANGNYSFIGLNGNEFPLMPSLEDEHRHFAIGAPTLLAAINKTIFCTADDELRPVMNGIYFDLSPEHVTLVATDAHRLVRYINRTVHVDEAASFILPKKPANILRNILAKEEEQVNVYFGQKNVMFEFGKTVIMARLIDGRYPNYNGVIPQNNSNVIVIDRLTMLNACRRVAVFANNGTALLKLAISDNQINISAQDIDFSTSAEETLACSYSGEPISIGFKAPFLIELMGAIESDDVEFRLADSARAGLILPTEQGDNEEVLMLLMPMLLND